MTESPSDAPTRSLAPDDPYAAEGSAPPSGRRRRWLLVGLGVVMLALAIAAALLFWQLRQAKAEEDGRADALRYAQQTALNLTSISVDDLDDDLQQVLDGATGEFEQDFSARSENLREVLTTNKVVSEGKVLEAGLSRWDEDHATALVVVDATVKNTQNPDGGVNTYRMKLELERQGDRWLTSTLEFVG